MEAIFGTFTVNKIHPFVFNLSIGLIKFEVQIIKKNSAANNEVNLYMSYGGVYTISYQSIPNVTAVLFFILE